MPHIAGATAIEFSEGAGRLPYLSAQTRVNSAPKRTIRAE